MFDLVVDLKVVLWFGWGYININVSDLDWFVDFYCKFGFEIFILSIFYFGLDNGLEVCLLVEEVLVVFGIVEGIFGCVCIM